MKFVGGPMHGLEADSEQLWFMHVARMQADGGIFPTGSYVAVELIGRGIYTYQVQQWFYRPGRELIPYLLYAGDWVDWGGEEGQLRAQREVLPC